MNRRKSNKTERVIIILSFLFSSFAQEQFSIEVKMPADGSTTPDTRPCDNPFISHSADSSIPFPTQFAWGVSAEGKSLVYNIALSEDTIFTTDEYIVKGLADTVLSIWNLKINTLYYWKITATDNDGVSWNTPVLSFKTADAWPRMIYIDGTTNVRDIGGRRNMDGLMIRQGIFYRSAEFNQTYTVTPKGVEQLKRLGIVCEIDLRNETENPLPLPIQLRRYFRPVTDSGGGIYDYEYGLVVTAALYGDVFREMADSRNYPMICHCRIGADRTGTVVALLEALLGCSEQQMGENYIWTSLSINGVRDTASAEWRGVISLLKSFDREKSSVQAGAWYYLLTQGLTVDELISIRKIFTGDERQPFPALQSVSRKTSQRIMQSVSGRYLTGFSMQSIEMEKGVYRLALYSLRGEKIWELDRKRTDTEQKIVLPSKTQSVGIIYSYRKVPSP